MRKIVVILTSGLLALTPAAQAQEGLTYYTPQPQGGQTANILTGLALLGILGAVAAKSRDRDEKKEQRREEAREREAREAREQQRRWHGERGWERGHPGRHSGWNAGRGRLPVECLRLRDTEVRGRGIVRERFFGARCLERELGTTRHLPRRCAVEVRGRGHERRAFEADCMAREGWTVARLR